jgi:hypothetical protein
MHELPMQYPLSVPMLAAHKPPAFTWAFELTLMGAATLPFGGEAVGPVQAESAPATSAARARRREMPKNCRKERVFIGVSIFPGISG